MRLSAPLLACALVACAQAVPAEPSAPDDPKPEAEIHGPRSCVAMERVKAGAPPDMTVAEIDNPAAFLRALNATPPVTHFEAERVLVAHKEGRAVLFLFVGGCLVGYYPAPWALVETIIGEGT